MLNYFADPIILLKGLLIGSVVGFILQQGKVTRFNVIINQFLFKDFTMIKVMLSALVVGTISLYSAHALGFIDIIFMPHSSTIAVLVGGLVLGTGLAISGYCPSIAFAAIGQGSKDAIFAAIGLFAGAGLYAELHNWFNLKLFKGAVANITTLPQLLGISNWIFIILFSIISIIFLFYINNSINNK